MRPTKPLRLPEIVAHADWSTNPPGRQVAIARRVGARYTAAAPHAVGAIGALFDTLQAEAGPGGTILLGGWKVHEEQNYSSGVPILNKIPLISAFFSRKGNYINNRKLLILLKASIVLWQEHTPSKAQLGIFGE